ncbi:hypothetical protein PR202_gb22706 [Eleusine coracana subsp. coracana]|uniref:Trichome birefringence-like C-terminal domain-containing protein n=1 Tax=Eleusine coracana subsp. coracana TaxID=191504 RepID=A0AAV5FH14_ELECO|nr:hypothetical protein PR202_gb22706 [Eleusine coracana subsp. coracana]
MKGGCLHRLLVNKLCFGLVVLLAVPILVLLLEGAPVLTFLSSTPEQLKAFSQGFQQEQEQEHLGHDVSPLLGSSGPSSRSHTQSRTKLNKDFSYESFRWQPHGCEMPEFTGANFLDRMKHKTLAFVGDSLGRQQFQSMMCIATGGKYTPEVEDVGWKYGLVKAPGALRPDGWAYRFPTTNTTILFYWSASLSELEPLNTGSSGTTYALHLDRPVTFLKTYVSSFDALVLNTGHHWNRGKFNENHWELYADGKPVGKGRFADLNRAKNLTLHSIARWMDSEIARHPQMKVFLRTMSPRHFVNGDWNTGGTCGNTIPLSHGSEVLQDHSSDFPAESAVNGTRVKLLDITAISQLRDEGHVSNSTFKAKASTGIHDCLHWCLPGIPDMWNELLFAQI